MNNFGGWAIDESAFNWIIKNIKKGTNILELGSGTGTIELSKNYNIYSIEHDKNYLNLCKNSIYIYAEIIDKFYNIKKIENLLPKKYDLLLIDGPPKAVSDRNKFLEFTEYFNLTTNILVDDTNRKSEFNLLKELSRITKRKYKIIGNEDKSFGIILK
jgi:16S rRNA G966 N2-methylase RsmD